MSAITEMFGFEGWVGFVSFGERLRTFRRGAGLTIEELAEASGVSARAISDMERGHSRAPQARTLAALADALALKDDDRDGLIEQARSGRSDSTAGRPRTGRLPRGVGDFVGRAGELTLIWERSEQASADRPTAVILVHGSGGLGKTALAIQAAEQLQGRFPDDPLYLDLRGMDAAPLTSGEALNRLLRALDVNPRSIADDVDERSSQLRALLRERRCLVVLDNAADEAQVRPLLPGLGAGLVLMTSRRTLGGLDGILRIGLPPLSDAESAQLLETIAGSAPTADVSAVTAMCGNLPLALRIAGTRLASRPGWTMNNLARRLADADRRLANLATGDVSVATAFGLSYNQLQPGAQATFRRLAHVPGSDFAAPIAAVLTASGDELGMEDVYAAEDQLDELVDLGLLLADGADRYRFHDLLRLFAADRLTQEEPADTRSSTENRMHDWLLETAVMAGRWYEPGFGAPPKSWRGLVPLGDPDQAHAWLQAEGDNWIAAFRAAAAAGRDQLVVDVAEAMHWYSDRSTHWPHWPEVYFSSRTAAARLPDRRQELAHINYASWAAGTCQRRNEVAAELAMEAYRLAEALDDVAEQANALYYLALAQGRAGNSVDALDAFGQARALADAAGNDDMYVQMGCGLGYMLRKLRRADEAIDVFRAVLRELDERTVAAAPARVARVSALVGLTEALSQAQRWEEALETAEISLPAAVEFGGLALIGDVHIAIGRAHAALGSVELAREHLRRGIGFAEAGMTSAYVITEAKAVLASLEE